MIEMRVDAARRQEEVEIFSTYFDEALLHYLWIKMEFIDSTVHLYRV